MRNSKSDSTPKANAVQNEKIPKNAEKSSGKKLKQARLPFKTIAASTSPLGPGSTAASGKDAVEENAEGRKRKLSYDTEDDGVNNGLIEDDNVSKENVEILVAATKKKKVSAISSNDNISQVVSLLDDDDDEDLESNKDSVNTSVLSKASKKGVEHKTPQSAAKDKRKISGTPKTTNAQKDKSGSASKLQIKLPISAGKKKRRKSSINNLQLKNEAEKVLNSSTQELSSDDTIEEVAAELNPHKRQKLNNAGQETKTQKTKRVVTAQEKEIVTVASDSESETTKNNKTNETLKPTKELSGKEVNKNGKTEIAEKARELRSKRFTKSPSEKLSPNSKTKSAPKNCDHENIKISDSSDGNKEQNDEKEELEQSILSDNDNEADDETDNLAGKSVMSSDFCVNSKSQNFEQTQKDGKSSSTSSKVLTPKQIKLTDQRKKALEEKERKLQEEKLKKQQEKEEKELARKREREEKEEQKRKEREEKEDQKRKEREEKERKRLAEVEAKNEEKRKKNEAKEEELRKKEEERKRKEQEKEEAELKKKKAAQAFTKFFVAKTPNNNQIKNDEDSNTGDGTKILAFRPFQIKGDMKVAPITRKNFTVEAKNRLDYLLGCKSKAEDEEIVRRKPPTKNHLYLAELRSGKILPGKWRRPSTESKDDVILVEDELERVGQEILEETPAYVREEMRVKFYKFHDNRRPPYYGTWRKKSSVVKPKKPFAQDKKFFDYEIDSDDEWEEEEPGESLEDGSDEDKEKESEDEDYEVDNEWFVPHGHLSDEELQNEDEFGLGDDNTREAQKAKLQLLQQEFAQEMKKKTEKIKPRLIGCIWVDINGNQPSECAKIIWDTLENKAMIFVDPPLIEEPEVDRSSEANSPSTASNGIAEKTSEKLKPISFSDNMIKDLSKLLHGNNHAKNFLINEYIAHVENTEESIKNGDFRKPQKSVVRDKIYEIAEWQAVDAKATNFQNMEQTNIETNDKKKKKAKRRLCWVVKQEILDKFDLSSLKLQNSWQYTLTPKFDNTSKKDQTATALTEESNETSIENSGKEADLTSKEKSTKSHNTPSTPKDKKRVPLLMSVARGQQISTPTKNKLISQFLQQKNKDNVKPPPSSPITTQSRSNAVTSPNIEDDDVVMLD